MGGTTTGGFPYVTPDDHPLQFPAHSQALANKLQADSTASTSGVLTVAGTWTLLAGSQVVRRNGWIAAYGQASKPTTPASGDQLAWMPAGFAVGATWWTWASGAVASGGGLKMYLMSVDATGAIKVRGSSQPAAAETITFQFTFPAA